MLLPVFYLMDVKSADITGCGCRQYNLQAAFKLRCADLAQPFSAKLYEQHQSFCLFVEWDTNSFTQNKAFTHFTDAMIAAAFHYKYEGLQSGYPFFIINDISNDLSEFIEKINSCFVKQGFNGIKYIAIQNKSIASFITDSQPPEGVSFIKTPGDADTTYYNLLLSDAPFSNLIIAEAASCAEVQNIVQRLNETERRLKEKHPKTYYLLSMIADLAVRNTQTQEQLTTLYEKVKALEHNLKQDLGNKGYRKKISKIVEFYKYEYEILPKWYKQLGHIIKVLMGKRTFKSLFKDDVKKYTV